ncbi:MAG: PQQ-binding-like beta-propeller repeat protein [Planctomycetota bacterium]|nr:PQQ-binding-like beta-propeller repeat protein [Planctomycetota bacterium]
MISRRLRLAGVVALACTSVLAFTPSDIRAEEEDQPKKEEPKKEEPKEEKPKGPEHNVTLSEEEDVTRLLKKAKTARTKAEQDPEAWPDCIKAYSDILAKYPNTVYLARWEGDGLESAKGYGLGVYRSTSEKVAEELASLPAAALRIYRAVNDGTAQALMGEAMETQNEAPMEKVAQTYFTTSWGDDALIWLAAMDADHGADRQALTRLARIEKHPDPSVPKVTVLALTVVECLKAGQRAEAQKNFEALAEALKDPQNGELRVGHESGAAALAALKARLDAAPKVEPAAKVEINEGWDTYFGNAAHNQPLPPKATAGVRKWSESLARLLGAPAGAPDRSVVDVRNPDNTVQKVSMANTFLTARGPWFFVCNAQVIACHSTSNPNPDKPVFWYPNPPPQPQPVNPQQNRYGANMGLLWHPQFVTLGPEHLFVTLGPEPVLVNPQWFGGNPPKQSPNWIVCLGKKKGGTMGVESGSEIWSLEPKPETEQDYRVNSKADLEWLKTIRFVSTPTYAAGALYVMAVSDSGNNRESWCVSIDATNGHVMWKTKICEAQPLFYGGAFQPDMGLPVAVQGGVAYCVTNLGAVAAIEAATGGVKWIRIYDRAASPGNDPNMRFMPPNRDLWAPNPPMVYQGLLICTPQDSDLLYAFDAQTGRRLWQTERCTEASYSTPGDAERLKYVMGICHDKYLVVAGRNMYFIDIKGGKRDLRALVPEEEAGKIVGTGLVTDAAIWVPTEKQLLRIDTSLAASGKPKAKILAPTILWQDPKTDPGNLFLVNDVVFSVSPSHVCAYFVWEDLEKKLKDRLAANPNDLPAYVEMGDGYHVVKQYDKAIEAYTKGIEAAGASKDASAKGLLADLTSRRFESYFADAEGIAAAKEGGDEAFKKAYDRYEAGLKSGATNDQSVRALWKMAEARAATKDDAAAVLLYQRMLAEFGSVVYPFEPKNTSMASVFAQREIGKIKDRNKGALAKLDEMAREELQKAAGAKDAKALERFIQTYPNAESLGDGLLALGGLHLEKGEGDAARPYYQRFLIAFRESPRTAEVLALLSLAYQKAGMVGSAKSTLLKLTRNASLAGMDVTLPGQAAQKAGAWAAERLKEPVFQTPATNAARSLGNGKLTESWSKPLGNAAVALVPPGKAPSDLKRCVMLVENGEILVYSGTTGDDLWTPHPKVPQGFNAGRQGRSAWADDLLILGGNGEIVAYDTKQAGKVKWRFPISPNAETGGGQLTSMQAAERRIVFTQQGGLLTVVDTGAGKEVWRTQVDGAQILGQPDLGEGFIAVATTNPAPHKITIYEIDTGLRRLDIPVAQGRLTQPPAAVDEFVYFVDAENKLRAHSAADGKELWNYDLETPAQRVVAEPDAVMVVLADLTLVVLDPNAAGASRLKWKARPDHGGTFAGVVSDGEEVFYGVRENTRKGGEVSAYNARGGKLLWKTELAASDNLDSRDLAQGHLLVLQSSFDPQGQAASMAAVVHRASGRRTWTQNLASGRPPVVALYDGGVAVGDGRKITGYVALDPARSQQEASAIEAELKKNPGDPALKLKLAQFQFESKETGKAMETILALLNDANATDETFAAAYERLGRFRKQLAKEAKPELTFAKVAQPLPCDGTMGAWEQVPAVKLDSWKDLYLTGEVDARVAVKKGLWKGGVDLSATFRGAYDEKHLYLCVEVHDDIHKNAQTKPVDLWNGDSVQFAFDMERDKRMGYFGEDAEVGLGLGDKGAQFAWRWVEHGKYLMKPLESPAKVVRDEEKKTTLYQVALPLDTLGLKPEADAKFGFTFMVNDLDAGDNVEKGAAPSPGIWEPKNPGQYAVGVLGK